MGSNVKRIRIDPRDRIWSVLEGSREMNIPESDQQRIFEDNARRILRLRV